MCFKMRNILGILMIGVVFLISGCSTAPVVQPTIQESQAARVYKKTIAIADFDESSSQVKGVSQIARADVENLLSGHFNVLSAEKSRQIVAERNRLLSEGLLGDQRLRQRLGVDYLLFGNVSMSVIGPDVDSYEYKNKDHDFSGYIQDKFSANTKVTIKIIDINTGAVLYTDTKGASEYKTMNRENFTNEERFRDALRIKQIAYQTLRLVRALSDLQNEYSAFAARTITSSVARFRKDLKSGFPISGEIVQVFAEDKKVMINLGSAYGLRPGDKLIVFSEGAPIRDPKTGLLSVPKNKKAELKVNKVVSGLMCEAKGKKKEIAKLQVGDIVYTYK